jgi:hypothetical protein
VDFAEYGYEQVQPTTPPEYNPDYERLVEGAPVLEDGAWTQTWTVEPAGITVDEYRQQRWDKLREDNGAHIYAVYDEGTQNTLNALAAQAILLQHTAAIAELQGAFVWISSVLVYYYTIKAILLATTTHAEVAAVTWDFPANAPAPADPVKIDEVMAMIQEA